jgi:hypothetical protein
MSDWVEFENTKLPDKMSKAGCLGKAQELCKHNH